LNDLIPSVGARVAPTILVTGASGSIGSRLVDRLVKDATPRTIPLLAGVDQELAGKKDADPAVRLPALSHGATTTQRSESGNRLRESSALPFR
jgi:nucleoside-diphosphate-sugar epimerase